MGDDSTAALGALRVDEEKLKGHVAEVVRSSVEETLNGLLDAEADAICRAQRYERSAERIDTRAGHYERKLGTQAGEVTLRVPKLRSLPFETAIIERYRRRESSVEEALVEMYLAGVSVVISRRKGAGVFRRNGASERGHPGGSSLSVLGAVGNLGA
jgi:transposase-like protein